MKKGFDTSYEIIFLAFLLSILLIFPVNSTSLSARDNRDPEGSEAANSHPEKVWERYYEQGSDYLELPELEITDPAVKKEAWTSREYGVDENPYGIIGEAVVSYSFRTPKDWSVRNTVRRFALGGDMIIFRFVGDKGIWGNVTKLGLSGTSIGDERELAGYYSKRRSEFAALLEVRNGAEVTTVLHSIQGFTSGRSETISHYESYSTVKFPRGKYANISYYLVQKDLGYVVEVYIPQESLNRMTRSIAYLVGESFTVYRFR